MVEAEILSPISLFIEMFGRLTSTSHARASESLLVFLGGSSWS